MWPGKDIGVTLIEPRQINVVKSPWKVEFVASILAMTGMEQMMMVVMTLSLTRFTITVFAVETQP
jgi:hypothetical protein